MIFEAGKTQINLYSIIIALPGMNRYFAFSVYRHDHERDFRKPFISMLVRW